MTYSRITMIDELPPMTQERRPYSSHALPFEFGHMNQQQPSQQIMPPNAYYAEAVDKFPGIERKIRQNTPLDPYHFYNQQEIRKIENKPSAFGTSYVGSSMVPTFEEQHLPVETQNNLGYTDSYGMNNSYPVVEKVMVENYENSISCKDVCKHMDKCSMCTKQDKLERKIYLYTIIALAILVLILLLRGPQKIIKYIPLGLNNNI